MTIHSIEMNVQSPEWVLAGSLLGSVLSPDRKEGINVSPQWIPQWPRNTPGVLSIDKRKSNI